MHISTIAAHDEPLSSPAQLPAWHRAASGVIRKWLRSVDTPREQQEVAEVHGQRGTDELPDSPQVVEPKVDDYTIPSVVVTDPGGDFVHQLQVVTPPTSDGNSASTKVPSIPYSPPITTTTTTTTTSHDKVQSKVPGKDRDEVGGGGGDGDGDGGLSPSSSLWDKLRGCFSSTPKAPVAPPPLVLPVTNPSADILDSPSSAEGSPSSSFCRADFMLPPGTAVHIGRFDGFEKLWVCRINPLVPTRFADYWGWMQYQAFTKNGLRLFNWPIDSSTSTSSSSSNVKGGYKDGAGDYPGDIIIETEPVSSHAFKAGLAAIPTNPERVRELKRLLIASMRWLSPGESPIDPVDPSLTYIRRYWYLTHLNQYAVNAIGDSTVPTEEAIEQQPPSSSTSATTPATTNSDHDNNARPNPLGFPTALSEADIDVLEALGFPLRRPAPPQPNPKSKGRYLWSKLAPSPKSRTTPDREGTERLERINGQLAKMAQFWPTEPYTATDLAHAWLLALQWGKMPSWTWVRLLEFGLKSGSLCIT
ncbi:hypothetical protein H4R33_006426 [Dimargaris cristalligena]|nr:hypothetical protein H4R33_006426 [Dimargaris cristalligena]